MLCAQSEDTAAFIQNDGHRSFCLRSIVNLLVTARNFDRALVIAQQIPEDHEKSLCLYDMAKNVASSGDLDTAKNYSLFNTLR